MTLSVGKFFMTWSRRGQNSENFKLIDVHNQVVAAIPHLPA
jgi:hypothetical protein